MPDQSRRALVLAGGGIRVAWQAGVVQALYENGLDFDHGDATSGGIFTLGMLMSGVSPDELGARWRSLKVRRFVSLLPLRDYLRSPTSWPAMGGATGIVDGVLPHLGIDIDRIRAASRMTGTFNVANFDSKLCVAVPHDELDIDRLVAGVSLPIFLPAVSAKGSTWTDAVWIKDANVLEAVRRGCDEIWVAWCIGNTPEWGKGALEQYVHMIELSANSALFAELAQVAEINERRQRGEAVLGSTRQVVVHVVKPAVPLPLDSDFVLGRINAETLVAMGYRDAWQYLEHLPAGGVSLDHHATRMAIPGLGCRVSLRLRGNLHGGQGAVRVTVSMVAEIDTVARLHESSFTFPAVGAIEHPTWGYRPFVDATGSVTSSPNGRRILIRARTRVEGRDHHIEIGTTIPHRDGHTRGQRMEALSRWTLDRDDAATGPISEHLTFPLREVIRTLVHFEPSGARTLGDRAHVALAAFHAAGGGRATRLGV